MTRTAYLIEERDNPSSAYFLLPALTAAGCRVVRCGLGEVPHDLNGAVVVLARYVSPRWARAIARDRGRLSRLVYFMDDDVLDAAMWGGTPWRYRWKLWRLAARHRDWLQGQGAELWVSTPHLAAKYAAWGAQLIWPSAVAGAADGTIFFYHGTASHGPDIRWLRPVVGQVLQAAAELRFETVGGREVARFYRDLPGAWVVHPLSWPAYQLFAATGGRSVGLAPQVEGAFNRSRSYTKFFDITRSGAVGIYARGSACAAVVDDAVDGLVLPMEPALWARAIVELARDAARRERMLAWAREKAVLLSERAGQAYGELWRRRG